ncbi:MAG TPA: sugar ABC transporter permease [Candidatus Limnocylindria bacterium]|nr:sugar ABC transporter permease [Candidatus Limnocylindria bacterium]
MFVAVPLLLVVAFIWLPTLACVALSFTRWDGIGGLADIQWVGLRNYEDLFVGQPAFGRALHNNVAWLLVLVLLATPLGILFAVLLDRRLRGSAFYQSALYMPVVLSLALVGFIWQLQYSPEQGFINNLLGTNRQDNLIDWLGNRDINIWAVLVAAGWRHVGYITLIYLAGLRSVDPTLREAAAIDGAGEWQAFRRVTWPVMRPINVVIVVVTVIEALRAFDIVYVINRGQNGLELLSVLVANSILAEAGRIGYGSAVATVLLTMSLVPILLYMRRAFRQDAA